MDKDDLMKFYELTLTLDLAYLHHFEGNPGKYKSAEASIRLEFGNFWYRKSHQPEVPGPPLIESVVIYSSIFTAARVSHFDSLDDALTAVKTWYQMAKTKP